MKIDITKKVDLSYLGDAWKECFLEFRLPSYADIKDFSVETTDNKEAMTKAMTTIKELFVAGKAISEGKVIEVTKDDLDDFPVEIIAKCVQVITGQVDPKV